MTRKKRQTTRPAAEAIVPLETIERIILSLRGEKVILDADLAALYGVPTKALNQAVKRNLERFPADFLFQLTAEEKSEVVTNCDHLARLKFSPNLPYAFTEHGVLMAANVLNSQRAIQASVQVVRAFVRMRRLFASHEELARKLDDLERKYDAQLGIIFLALDELLIPPEPKRKPIGFQSKQDADQE